jgi:GR25 family glycosyltransferase involved in LPS biosynthesis
MRAFVITILGLKLSYDSAQRCIRSGQKYNTDVHLFSATTPSLNPVKIMRSYGIDHSPFEDSVYSRDLNAMSCFLSHFELWRKCANGDETFLILEHDAVITGPIPNVMFDKVLNIGAPSYGRFNTPTTLGVGPLVSKRYFPGAHGYLVNPKGAAELVKQAKIQAAPTDVFLHLDTFPWLQEYYPYVVEARDSFTTVQQKEGCKAKHNYVRDPEYRLLEI